MRHIAISIVAALAWTDAAIVSARAESVNVYDDHGGSVADYDARWSELAARGANVRVVGPCQSACTVLLAHIPNDRICVTPQALGSISLIAPTPPRRFGPAIAQAFANGSMREAD